MNSTNPINQHRKIRATMVLHGVTQGQIAAQEKVSEGYVTFVVTGRRVGHRIRAAIARACGVSVTELWPDEKPDEEEPDDPEMPAAA